MSVHVRIRLPFSNPRESVIYFFQRFSHPIEKISILVGNFIRYNNLWYTFVHVSKVLLWVVNHTDQHAVDRLRYNDSENIASEMILEISHGREDQALVVSIPRNVKMHIIHLSSSYRSSLLTLDHIWVIRRSYRNDSGKIIFRESSHSRLHHSGSPIVRSIFSLRELYHSRSHSYFSSSI